MDAKERAMRTIKRERREELDAVKKMIADVLIEHEITYVEFEQLCMRLKRYYVPCP